MFYKMRRIQYVKRVKIKCGNVKFDKMINKKKKNLY